MTGPENFWEGLGAAGSAASVAGLLIAGLAERRARAAELRAASVEAKVDAAVRRVRRAALLSDVTIALLAGRQCSEERVSVRRWEGHARTLRTAVIRLREASCLTPDERTLVGKAFARVTGLRFSDGDSDRDLRRALDELDTLHARLLNALADSPDD